MMSKRKSRLLGGGLFIAGALLLLAAPRDDTAPESKVDDERYTFMLESLGLPHIPDSKITGFGCPEEGESDYEIELETQNSPERVGELFEDELTKHDSRSGGVNSNHKDRYQNEFRSGDYNVYVDANRDPDAPDASRVRIVVRRDFEVKTRAYHSATRVD